MYTQWYCVFFTASSKLIDWLLHYNKVRCGYKLYLICVCLFATFCCLFSIFTLKP